MNPLLLFVDPHPAAALRSTLSAAAVSSIYDAFRSDHGFVQLTAPDRPGKQLVTIVTRDARVRDNARASDGNARDRSRADVKS